jgi:hypothetical protein
MSNPKFQTPYKAYVPNDTTREISSDMKMYILINRSQLTLVQAGVQAAHALAEYPLQNPNCESYKKWVSTHKTLIFLEANERQMDETITGLKILGKKCAKFIEPDMGKDGVFTALAIEPVLSDEGKLLFGQYKLLK